MHFLGDMEVSRDKKMWMITEEVKPFFVCATIRQNRR